MSKMLYFSYVGLAAALLSGCGQASPYLLSSSSSAAASNAAQAAVAPVSAATTMTGSPVALAAQEAIQSRIMQATSNANVQVSAVELQQTPLVGLYAFSAIETVHSSHGLYANYRITGTYGTRDARATISSSVLIPGTLYQ